MKRKTLALTLALALLFSAMAGTQLSLLAKANVYIPPMPPLITIVSPTNSTYNVNTLSLEVTVRTIKGMYHELKAPIIFTYTLDERTPERISIENFSSPMFGDYPEEKVTWINASSFEVTANLANLTDGLHSLRVYVYAVSIGDYEGGEDDIVPTKSNATVNFRVDSVPPAVVLLSLENKTYSTTDVALNFTVNEADTQVTYSLDGQENVTTVGNTTLTNLSSGEHSVTVYAEDIAGNVGFSETIHFRIEPFPTTLVAAASVASAGVVAMGLVVYFKKRKH